MTKFTPPVSRRCIWLMGLAAMGLFAAAHLSPYTWLLLPGGFLLSIICVSSVRCLQQPSFSAVQAAKAVFAGNFFDFKTLKNATGVDRIIGDLARVAQHKHQDLSQLRQGLTGLKAPILLCDARGRIVFANNSLCDTLRKPSNQVHGKALGEVFFGRSEESLPLETGQDTDREIALRLWDGRTWHVRCFQSPILDIHGQSAGFLLFCVDLQHVTEQRERLDQQNSNQLRLGETISEVSQRMASAAEELAASADEQAQGARSQKEQTGAVSMAMEEMAATVLDVAKNASSASQAAHEARESARTGVDMVDMSASGITGVADSARVLAQVLTQLNGHAGSIGRVINVINEIADQTNLLALNAAIEAARAGDAGRGFAVVADEVRKLAEKTMTATKEVEQAVLTMQGRSEEAVASMEQTEHLVRESTEHANQIGEMLKLIMHRVEDVVSQVEQIAAAAEEQTAATEEISQSIENIAMIARESDEGADQTAAATRDLARLAHDLLSLARIFSAAVRGDEMENSGHRT